MSRYRRSSCIGIPYLGAGLASLVAVAACAELPTPGEGANVYPASVQAERCMQESFSITEVLGRSDVMVSELSGVDCHRSIDGEQGYFETWQIFADTHATVVLEVDSEFDSLMRLLRVVEVDGDQLTTELVAENDDRAMDDPRARVSATLRKADNYLLRVSGFADEDTGLYTVVATPNEAPDPPPKTGSIEVRVETEGPFPGYTVTLNGSKPRRVAGDGTTEYDHLLEGTHAVVLTDLGECTVDGADTQNVVVSANQTSDATFRVSCPIPVGTVRIVTTTTGVDIDPIYRILLQGEIGIGSNEWLELDDIPVGRHTVWLTQIAQNCDAISEDTQDFAVLADSVTTVNFTLQCRPRDSPRIVRVDVRRETEVGSCEDFTEYRFEYAIYFIDCNGLTPCEGDVTATESAIDFLSIDDYGNTSSYTSQYPAANILAGEPVLGALHHWQCVPFKPFSAWKDVTITLKDAAGLASNPFTVRIDHPGQ